MPGALARSSARTTAVLALRLVTQAITLVLVSRWLGPARYGEYVAVASLAVLLSLLPNLGAGYVLMEAEAKSPGAGRESVRYGLPLGVALGAVGSLLFPVVAKTVGTSFTLTELWLIGAAELLTMPSILMVSSALQAVHRVASGQMLQWTPFGLRAIVAAACFLTGPAISFPVFIVLQALASGMGLIVALCVGRFALGPFGRPRKPSHAELAKGASYAAMQAVAANPNELDKILAVRFVGEHAAGIYSTASRVMSAMILPVISVLLASQPRLFRYAATPTATGRRLIATLCLLSFGWGVVTCIGAWALAPYLGHVFGPAYAEAALVMPWVALAAPFIGPRLAAGTVLAALGRPLQRLWYELAGTALLAACLYLGARLAQTRGMAIALVGVELAMAVCGWWMIWRATDRLHR